MASYFGARGGAVSNRRQVARDAAAMRRAHILANLAAVEPVDRIAHVLKTLGGNGHAVSYDDLRRVGVTVAQVDKLIDKARRKAFRAAPELHAIQEMVGA